METIRNGDVTGSTSYHVTTSRPIRSLENIQNGEIQACLYTTMGISVDAWRARIGNFMRSGSANLSAKWRPIPGGASPGGGIPLSRRIVSLGIRAGLLLLILLVIGGIEPNPGPVTRNWKYPCGTCQKPVKNNQRGLQCDSCGLWSHLNCLPDAIHVTLQEYNRLSSVDENGVKFRHSAIHSSPSLPVSLILTAQGQQMTATRRHSQPNRNNHKKPVCRTILTNWFNCADNIQKTSSSRILT